MIDEQKFGTIKMMQFVIFCGIVTDFLFWRLLQPNQKNRGKSTNEFKFKTSK